MGKRRRGGLPTAPQNKRALDRLAIFTELMATAIANGDARAEIERLAAEQAARRGVATLEDNEATTVTAAWSDRANLASLQVTIPEQQLAQLGKATRPQLEFPAGLLRDTAPDYQQAGATINGVTSAEFRR